VTAIDEINKIKTTNMKRGDKVKFINKVDYRVEKDKIYTICNMINREIPGGDIKLMYLCRTAKDSTVEILADEKDLELINNE